MSGNKYHNVRRGGFDSRREARRYQELLLLQRVGKIADIKRQVPFELIPAQREPDIVGPKGGRKPGETIERSVNYVADFVYTDLDSRQLVVEDAKGVRTPEYVIKRKLMLQKYGIRIKEV